MQPKHTNEADRGALFFSHASADRELAQAVRNLLLLGGVPSDLLFFTSGADTAVTEGDNFEARIDAELASSPLVLCLITPHYMSSPQCLQELGAARALKRRLFPILVPPVSFDEVNRRLGTLQCRSIGQDAVDETLDRLLDRLNEDLPLGLEVSAWSQGKESFKEVLARIGTSSPISDLVPGGGFSVIGHLGTWDEFYDRIYHLSSSEWSYDLSDGGHDRWKAVHIGRRDLTSLVEGLDRLEIEYSRPETKTVPFSAVLPPEVELLDWHRHWQGEVALSAPHKIVGSTFAFFVRFYPPLALGERVNLRFKIVFPEYKYGFREDLIAGSSTVGGDVTDQDYNSRTVQFLTERLVLSVFLPNHLRALPGSIEVSRRRIPYPEERDTVLRERLFSVCRETSANGPEGWLLRVERDNPPMQARYLVTWTPPGRSKAAEAGRPPDR